MGHIKSKKEEILQGLTKLPKKLIRLFVTKLKNLENFIPSTNTYNCFKLTIQISGVNFRLRYEKLFTRRNVKVLAR